jgi:triphosphoribosyl-dephospho-CoA synthetase
MEFSMLPAGDAIKPTDGKLVTSAVESTEYAAKANALAVDLKASATGSIIDETGATADAVGTNAFATVATATANGINALAGVLIASAIVRSNEFVVTANCSRSEYEYVLNELRSINK